MIPWFPDPKLALPLQQPAHPGGSSSFACQDKEKEIRVYFELLRFTAFLAEQTTVLAGNGTLQGLGCGLQRGAVGFGG